MSFLKYEFFESEVSSSPLWIMIHGRAGNIDVMKIFGRKLPHGVSALYIEAPFNEKSGGYSWWDVHKYSSPSDNVLNRLISTIEHAIKSNNINPTSKNLIGFSQGGSMCAALILSNPIVYQNAALLCSFIPNDVKNKFVNEYNLFKGYNRLDFTSFIFLHGSEDKTVTYDVSLKSAKFLIDNEFKVEYLCSKGTGHKLSSRAMKLLGEWIRNNT